MCEKSSNISMENLLLNISFSLMGKFLIYFLNRITYFNFTAECFQKDDMLSRLGQADQWSIFCGLLLKQKSF